MPTTRAFVSGLENALRRTTLGKWLRLRRETAEQSWLRAEMAQARSDATTAREIYRALARRRTTTPQDFLYAGLASYRLGRAARATEILAQGHYRHPGDALLAEHCLRLCVEQQRLRWLIDTLDARGGRSAFEQLVGQSEDWNTQVDLVAFHREAGAPERAETSIRQIIEASDNVVALWRLGDIFLACGRKDEAAALYRRLSARAIDGPDAALYASLSFERLLEPHEAAARLEAQLARYPNAAYLREHYLRISFEHGLFDRLARWVDPGADSAEAIEAALDRFSERQQQLKIVNYYIDKGDLPRVRLKLNRGPGEPPDPSDALFHIALRLTEKGFAAEAGEIYRSLMGRPRESMWDSYFAAASALRLSDIDGCLTELEQGLRLSPTSVELGHFYLQISTYHLKYQRYAAFMATLPGKHDYGGLTVSDVYITAMRSDPLVAEAVIMNYRDIQHLCTADQFAELLRAVLESVGRAHIPRDKIRMFTFFSRYLDLDEAFAAALRETFRLRPTEGAEPGDALAKEERVIEMLFRLTPPMVPSAGGRAEPQMRQFIDACYSLARAPLELADPIRDMSNNWTPWQYLFCLGAMESYNAAIAALESLAFATWPRLNHTASHVIDPALRPAAGRRIRIGFMVHDSMPMMSGLLAGLDKNLFETVFIRPGVMGPSRAARGWVQRAERVVEVSDMDVYAAIDAIAAEQFDIIVSGPSVAAVFFPMMARLAHLQMVLLEPNWTDGLTHADYYISWKPAEPADVGRFYRSRVALLDEPPYYIERHAVEAISDAEKAELRQRLFGPRASGRIYLCANTPPKIHPDMDGLFRRLLESDPEATLVFLRGEYPPSKTLRFRLHQRLGALIDRVVFLPTLKQADAHGLLLSVDCCLDSFPLCGMSSSFDAAMLGVPMVTLPAEMPFGKWTATIYQHIGVSGLTATSEEDYLQIALRLANDPAWRQARGAELRQKAGLFVESAASVGAFARFIARAWERHLAGLPPADWSDADWHTRATPPAPILTQGEDRMIAQAR